MTVQTNTNSIAYVGNGSTVHFDYDFLILDSAHLKVYFDSVLQTSGYVVSGVGSQSGGTVAFAAAPANGVGIDLVRDVPFYQLTDYQPYDAFPADTHERALDLLTMMAQQLKDELGRTLQHPVGGNKWDAEGNEIINVGTGNSGTSATNVDQVKYLIASEVGDDPSASASVRSREALRRSYAEAGYNLVDGSFESGGVLTSPTDVLLHEATGKAYSGNAGNVAAGTDPTSGGFTDRSQALSHFVTAKTAEKAVELINSGAKSVLLITDGVDEIDQPLTIANVHDWQLSVSGTIHQPKHGYNGIVIEGCHGWRIAKSGLIQGHGSFPDKNINGGDGGGEKHYSLTVTGRFSQDTGGVDMGLGTFGGGYIGNVGSGITIRKGCKNFYCGISATGFNGYGVIVGDLRTSLSNQLEVLSTDGLIDGELYSNYIAGVGVLACENVNVADEAYIHDNGHPDAIESDGTIDPGYGFTSCLVSNAGSHARNCTVGDCRLIGNKRKGFDVHSGDNIRCRSPYIAFSMIEGIAYAGTTGIRRGGGWDSPTIKNCGTATGGNVDAKTGISVSGVFDGITPSGRAKLTNCGITYGIYWAANRSSFGGGFDLDNSLAAFTGGRPIYIQGASGAELTRATLDDLTANGTWTNPALVTYAKNCSLDKWNFTGATITSGNKQLEMTNCDISIGGQNRWKAPQFNTGNVGTMETAKSTVVVSYNGTSVVADIAKIASGARYISSITSGGSGIVVIGANNSDEPAISPPFEHTASVADVTLSSATFANVNYGKLRTPCETSGGRQQVIISPRDASTGAVISINSASISELKLNVTINWTFQL